MVLRTIIASAAAVVLASLLLETGAFTSSVSPARRASSLSESFGDALQDTFSKLPFGKQPDPEPSITPLPPLPFEPTPEGVIQRAKLLLSCDLGVQDESLLDPSFVWIGPNLGSKALGKIDYLAAGKFFDLRSTFPDLDYRAHDFRIDEQDPMTVRVTARIVGTMRGELRLRNEVLPPNGKRMRCPPEAISMTFDEQTGKLLKLCSGFAMDRLIGNTGGLCGVMGAATIAGSPPSEWESYPATKVVQRFFGRPDQRLDEPSAFLAPFPETVMVQLAKGIFSANMAVADSDLLAPSFTYCTAYDGPIRKDKYLEKYASKIFNGLEPELSYFRVDPYDPYRVWVDARPKGTTLDGVYVDAPPQAFSFTFDDEGFCTRLTAGAVMDPSIGNTGGLCCYEGEQYAAGNPAPEIATRPLPQVLDRLRKLVLSPVTKIGVDDYGIAPSENLTPVARTVPSPVDKLQAKRPSIPLQSTTKAPEETEEAPPQKRPTLSIPTFSFPAATPPASQKQEEAPPKKRPTLTIPTYAFSPAASSTKSTSVDAAEVEARQKAEAAAIAAKKKAEDAAKARQARAEAAEAERVQKAKAAAQAAASRALEEAVKAEQEKRAALERKAEELAAAKAKIAAEKKAASEKRAEEAAAARIAQRQEALKAARQREAKIEAEREAAAKRRAEEAEAAKKARAAAIKAAAPRPSLSLLGLGGQSPSKPMMKKTTPKPPSAPRPSLSLRGLGGPSPPVPAPRPSLSLLGLGGPSASKPVPKKTAPPAPAPRPSISLLGLGGPQASKPAPKKTAPPAPAPRPSISLLGLGGPSASKPVPKKAAPPVPAPRPSISLLGFGGTSASKPVLKKTAPPAPPPRPSISLLGLGVPSASKPVPKKAAPKLAPPAPSPRPTLSLLGLGGPTPGEPAPPAPSPRPTLSLLGLGGPSPVPKPAPVPSPRPTLSLFGLGGPTVPPQKEKAPAPAPALARRSTISLFKSGGKAAEKSKPAPNKKEPKPPTAPRASISLFGGGKKSPAPVTSAPKGVPSFQKWRKNPDGSITGIIFGSPAFEEGTKVTTSPIASGDIKRGSVVKTSSGSRYFLT